MLALQSELKSAIHCSMTLPCAVDPEDRRSPSAQANPAPSKVVSPPAAAPPDAGELSADDAEPAAEAAEVGAAAADEEAGALLSLPQALRVNAPTATRASSPLMRVIFTLVPPSSVTTTHESRPVRARSDAGRPTRRTVCRGSGRQPTPI